MAVLYSETRQDSYMQLTPLEPWIAHKIGLTGQQLDIKALQAWQLKKLNETLHLASQKSIFYRRHLQGFPNELGCLSDLQQLPLTSAADLRANPLAFVCVSQDEIARVVTLQTSGTSGLPKRLFFTTDDQELTTDFFGVGMETLTKPGDQILILLPVEKPGSVGDLLRQGLQRVQRTPIPYGPVRDPLDALMQIDRLRIECLVGSPSQVLGLAQRWEVGMHRPRSVLLSTDYVPQAILNTLENSWGCQVFNHYGTTEMGLGGGVDCEVRRGYHLREADLYFEMIDPSSGKLLPPGEYGEVVFTTLTRQGMPLIRYRMGDRSRFIPGQCPCGTQLKTLEHVSGRWEGFLTVGEQILRLSDLDEALFALPGLLDFKATLQGSPGQEELLIEAIWEHEVEDSNAARSLLLELPSLQSVDVRISHRYEPDYPGSLQKRIIHDLRHQLPL